MSSYYQRNRVMPSKRRSAFMMFVTEFRNKTAEGRKMNIGQAISRCDQLWTKMDGQQRAPYKASAKAADSSSGCEVERLNSFGQPLSQVEREERDAAEQQMLMKRNIERIVLKGKDQHDLENTKFIFVAFNYFAKCASNDIYIPAEFAACRYALKPGKTSTYSSHINPNQLIFGQGSDTIHHTSTTHQLPLPPNALGDSNLGKMYSNILDYLRNGRGDSTEPLVVFTPTDMIPIVRGCFRYMESDMECDTKDNLDTVRICDLEYLFYVLKKEVMDLAGIDHSHINKSITDALFRKDFFEYHSGISCEYHEQLDRGKYCTQSIVSRWTYTFSDYMCDNLAIKPLPGKHMPPKQEIKYQVIEPNENLFSGAYKARSEVNQEVKEDLDGRNNSTTKRQSGSNSRDPRCAWNVPPLKRNTKDFEDAFNMDRQ